MQLQPVLCYSYNFCMIFITQCLKIISLLQPLCQPTSSSEEHAPASRHQTKCGVLFGVNKKLNIFCYKVTYNMVVIYEIYLGANTIGMQNIQSKQNASHRSGIFVRICKWRNSPEECNRQVFDSSRTDVAVQRVNFLHGIRCPNIVYETD